MSSVSVLGTGLMGSALARAFLAADHDVTIWNRSAAKTEPLVKQGARRGVTAAEVFAASPLSVICVHNYAAAKSFMETLEVVRALSGKTILQLTTGTTREAREGDAWAKQIGCGYLDGKIMAYPEGIGREDTQIYISGSRALFDSHQGLLSALGGRVTYLGEPIAYSATLDVGRLTTYFSQLVGFFYGLLLCRKEGYPIEEFVAQTTGGMRRTIVDAFARIARTIRDSTFDDAEVTVDTMAVALDSIARTFRDAGLNAELPALLHALFDKASAAGFGKEDSAALIKALDGARSAR